MFSSFSRVGHVNHRVQAPFRYLAPTIHDHLVISMSVDQLKRNRNEPNVKQNEPNVSIQQEAISKYLLKQHTCSSHRGSCILGGFHSSSWTLPHIVVLQWFRDLERKLRKLHLVSYVLRVLIQVPAKPASLGFLPCQETAYTLLKTNLQITKLFFYHCSLHHSKTLCEKEKKKKTNFWTSTVDRSFFPDGET